MEVIYGLIPGMILMGLVGVAVFFWAAKNGQFDDMQGEAYRILMDDDLEDEASLSPSDVQSDQQDASGGLDSESDAGTQESSKGDR